MPSCDLFPRRNSVVVAEFVLILFNNRTRWRFLASYLQIRFVFLRKHWILFHTFVSPSTTRVIHARRLTLFATAGVMFDKITTRSGSNEELLIKFSCSPNALWSEMALGRTLNWYTMNGEPLFGSGDENVLFAEEKRIISQGRPWVCCWMLGKVWLFEGFLEECVGKMIKTRVAS